MRCVVQAELQVLSVDSIDVYQPSVLAKCRDSGSEFLHSTIRQAATLALYATTLTCRIACTIPVAADVATTASDAAASLSHPAAVAVREFARRLIDALLDHVVAFTRYGGAIAWALGGAECLRADAAPPQQQQQRYGELDDTTPYILLGAVYMLADVPECLHRLARARVLEALLWQINASRYLLQYVVSDQSQHWLMYAEAQA